MNTLLKFSPCKVPRRRQSPSWQASSSPTRPSPPEEGDIVDDGDGDGDYGIDHDDGDDNSGDDGDDNDGGDTHLHLLFQRPGVHLGRLLHLEVPLKFPEVFSGLLTNTSETKVTLFSCEKCTGIFL